MEVRIPHRVHLNFCTIALNSSLGNDTLEAYSSLNSIIYEHPSYDDSFVGMGEEEVVKVGGKFHARIRFNLNLNKLHWQASYLK